MDDFGSKIIVGAIGAIIALYLKYWYDESEKKKRLDLIRHSFVNVLKEEFLPNLKELHKNGKNTSPIIKNFIEELHCSIKNNIGEKCFHDDSSTPNLLTFTSLYFMNLDLLSFFKNDDLIAIFKEQKIGSDTLYNLLNLQHYLKEQNPIIIYMDFVSEYDGLIEELKENKQLKDTNKKEFIKVVKDVQRRLDILEERILLTLKNNLDLVDIGIKNIEIIINKLLV